MRRSTLTAAVATATAAFCACAALPAPAAAEFIEYEYPSSPFGGGASGQLAFGAEGDLWFAGVDGPSPSVAGSGNGGIGRLSGPGDWEDIGAEPLGTFDNEFEGDGPVGIAVGPEGSMWFTAGRGIGRIEPSGTPPQAENFLLPTVQEAIAKNGKGSSLPNTSLGGITAGLEHENLWFTETEGNVSKIGRINATSDALTEFTLPAGNELGSGVGGLGDDDIAVGHEGNLWFTEPASQAIGVMNIKGEFLHKFAVATFPSSIAAGPDGDMWFTDESTPDVIGRITPAGEVSEFPSVGPSADIVEGPDGNMWFTTAGHSSGEAGLGCITPSGLTALHPDPTAAGLPWGIAVANNEGGSIWFTELGDYVGRLGRLSPVLCGAAPVPTPLVNPVVGPRVGALTPILSRLSETARRWREGNALAQISRSPKRRILALGTSFSFDLNEASSVTFTFEQVLSGRRVRKTCLAQTRRNRHERRCTRTLYAGTLTFSADAGTNTVRFEGLLSRGRRLALGGYTLQVTASARGEHSTAQTLHFTIANR